MALATASMLCIVILAASRVPAVLADEPPSTDTTDRGDLPLCPCSIDTIVGSASFQRSTPGCGDTLTGSTFGANNFAFNAAGDHLYLL